MPAFLTLDLLLLASELGLAWRRSAARTQSARHDRGSLRMLWIVIAGSIWAAHVIAFRGVGPRLPFDPWWGAAVFAAGAAVRWWSIVHLGRFFSVDVAIASDHRVVDTGPYRYARHPSYTGLLIEVLGLGMALHSGASMAVLVIPIFLALFRRIRVEEDALLANLGDAYRQYAARTKRLLPGIF